MASPPTPTSINHRRYHHHYHHHNHRQCQQTAIISTIPTTRFLAGNYTTIHTLSNPLLLQDRSYPPSNFNSNSRWCGRCPATSPRPPSPPSDEDQFSSSDLPAKLSRFQDRVQIFFAVLFWMSLFFWSSVWDRKNNDNGPPSRR